MGSSREDGGASVPHSITGWFFALRKGDTVAARRLWDHYFHELCRLAQRTLHHQIRTTAFDEEDVASDVLATFFAETQKGRHERVKDRDELWGLLVVITIRKAKMTARRERALKRGGGLVALESEIEAAGPYRLDQLIGTAGVACFSQFMSEQCEQLIESLRDPTLEKIALWRLAGHTNEEIAAELGCTRVTVQRKLRRIREIWEAESAEMRRGRVPPDLAN
jgi:DNA-directed RNA polymerase specialized sigma24 family protein